MSMSWNTIELRLLKFQRKHSSMCFFFPMQDHVVVVVTLASNPVQATDGRRAGHVQLWGVRRDTRQPPPPRPLRRPPAAPRSTTRGKIELNLTPPPRFDLGFFLGGWGEGVAENTIKTVISEKGRPIRGRFDVNWRGRFEADSRSIRGRFRRSVLQRGVRMARGMLEESRLDLKFGNACADRLPSVSLQEKALRASAFRPASFLSEQAFAVGVVLP